MAHFTWGTLAANPLTTGIDSSAGTLATPVPPPAAGSSPVITVGAGEMFATLSAALSVAVSGTTILVDAGTYNDDFGTVSTAVTIVGVGGTANFTADEAPPNEKGILTVDNNVTIENCSFSGAAISAANGGNGAGIRYEGGQMVLENDSFIGNQDGLLAFPVIPTLTTNTIVIDHCLFENNGAGDGYTHNAYIGAVSSLTFTNNISEGAIVGHELKSRALVNDIENNVFMDGPTGTASYSIDLPNGGQDTVLNNYIEKGPNSENSAAIHFGGEGIPYAGSSLLVSGNQFVNDYGAGEIGVLNQTPIPVTITGNQFGNFVPGNVAQGPAVETNNVDGNGNPLPNQTLTGVLPGNTLIITDSLAHTVSLTGTLLAVEGGAGLLTVTAIAGHVIAIGGSGGMNFSEGPGSGGNTITTLAGATDTIRVSGQDLIDSEGNDTLVLGAGNVTADLDGTSIVSDGTGNDQFSVNGTATITGHGGNPVVMVGATGSAVIGGTLGYLNVQNNGGNFRFSITQGGANEALTVSGGAMDVQVYGAAMSITTAAGPVGSTLHLGAGAATITSVGADTIYAGSGAETVILEGAATLYAGTGSLAVYGRSDQAGASFYGNGGTYTIAGDTGNITYYGGARASTIQAVLSNITLVGGAGRLTVNGGSNDLITGGTGGLIYSATDGGGNDTIVTASGAHDTLSLAAADTISSYGIDTINAGSGNQTISIYGTSIINGSTGNSQISVAGTATLNGVGYDACAVSAGGVLTANAGTLTSVTETGGTVRFNVGGAASASATLTGGQAQLIGGTSSPLTIVTTAGASTGVTLTSGAASVQSNGIDNIHAGSGADSVSIQAGTATITGGTGTLSVYNGDTRAADVQTVIGGRGAISLTQNNGTLNFIGGTGSATIDGGSGQLFITGGSGAINVMNGSLGEQIVAGTGLLTAALSSNGATVEFGAGTANIQEAGYGSADIFNFVAGHGGGVDTITGFRQGVDTLNFSGVTVKSETVVGTQTRLLLSDNTRIYLNGFADTQGVFAHH